MIVSEFSGLLGTANGSGGGGNVGADSAFGPFTLYAIHPKGTENTGGDLRITNLAVRLLLITGMSKTPLL